MPCHRFDIFRVYIQSVELEIQNLGMESPSTCIPVTLQWLTSQFELDWTELTNDFISLLCTVFFFKMVLFLFIDVSKMQTVISLLVSLWSCYSCHIDFYIFNFSGLICDLDFCSSSTFWFVLCNLCFSAPARWNPDYYRIWKDDGGAQWDLCHSGITLTSIRISCRYNIIIIFFK